MAGVVEERRGIEGWKKMGTIGHSFGWGNNMGHALLWTCVVRFYRGQVLKTMGLFAGCETHIDSMVVP